jgi:hypothetical protein
VWGLIPSLGSYLTESIFSDLPETPLLSPMPDTRDPARKAFADRVPTLTLNLSGSESSSHSIDIVAFEFASTT